MGFGIALASGFLKGINQNINFEKARRIKEDESIEGFQTQLNKAVLDSDGTNTAGIQAITKQLASARKQQKNSKDGKKKTKKKKNIGNTTKRKKTTQKEGT